MSDYSTYFVSDEDKKKINDWLLPIMKEEAARQKEIYSKEGYDISPIEEMLWSKGIPYHGAIGGGLSYNFMPTSIGVIFTVTYKTFDSIVHELNLTDYDSW